MNKAKHGNLWDNVHVVINQFYQEFAEMPSLDKLGQLEKKWLDPNNGKIANLAKHSWFADARYAARRIAQSSIRKAVQDELGNYRLAARLLD
jgi:hypothetical protein